jgi:glycosyltransferase involved in cell wall biosynthesis
MTIDKKTAYTQVVEYFSDTLADAEDAVKTGVLTPDDVVDAFVEAIDDWHSYFIDTAATYASIAKAVRERVSQA